MLSFKGISVVTLTRLHNRIHRLDLPLSPGGNRMTTKTVPSIAARTDDWRRSIVTHPACRFGHTGQTPSPYRSNHPLLRSSGPSESQSGYPPSALLLQHIA